jgi:uncharacterized protein (TIGR00299 family) protein
MTITRALIVEPSSGVSGDMFVAAAATLAGCDDEVITLPARLGLDRVTCAFRDVDRGGIKSRKFDVIEAGAPAERSPHHHAHRPLAAIAGLIEAARLEPAVAARARRMFETLGRVESEIHGVPMAEVHFHEVGAVDSIVDIVAAALCIERLRASEVYATPVCTGTGTVESAHGVLPVPAPATERLLQGMPSLPGELDGEWTTPSGALILCELRARFEIPALTTTASAYGAGGRDPEGRPNVLRLRLAEMAPHAEHGFERDEVVTLRCNIDDSPGELLGSDLIDMLLQAGARDVTIQPTIMKKGRPGYLVEVLSLHGEAERLAAMLLFETTTLGVRMTDARRLKVQRVTGAVETSFGRVPVKIACFPDGRRRTKPEYEACLELARKHGVPVETVRAAALRASDELPGETSVISDPAG